jgi:leader peptidase (prepilin peptidase)/N-methyltransferase
MIALSFTVLLGLVVGSFLNVCIYRLPKGLSIITPSSFCPSCGKKLTPLELIPVMGYLLSTGKCRHCGGRISPIYPVVEVLTAALFCLICLKFSLTVEALKYFVLISLLIVVSFIDIETMEISDSITLTGTAFGLAFSFAGLGLKNSLLGAALGFSSIFLLSKLLKAIYGKDAIGDGDATILMMIGSFCGMAGVLFSFYLGFLIGGLVGLAFVVLRTKRLGDAVPFGPYLALGAVIFVLFQRQLIAVCLRMLNIY